MSSEFCKKCGAQLSTSDNSCSKCGTQRIPENNAPHVKPNRFSKKTIVGMSVAIVVAAFFILVNVSGSLNQQQNVQDKSGGEQFIDKPLTEILPVRADIGTEWKIFPSKEVMSDIIGFVEGISQPLGKGTVYPDDEKYQFAVGTEGTLLRNTIYRFDSAASTLNHYTKTVSDLREEGEFQEITIALRNVADCYGTYTKGNYDSSKVICYKNNIFFITEVYGASVGYDNPTTKMAEIMSEKIN